MQRRWLAAEGNVAGEQATSPASKRRGLVVERHHGVRDELCLEGILQSLAQAVSAHRQHDELLNEARSS